MVQLYRPWSAAADNRKALRENDVQRNPFCVLMIKIGNLPRMSFEWYMAHATFFREEQSPDCHREEDDAFCRPTWRSLAQIEIATSRKKRGIRNDTSGTVLGSASQ
jgi:hypothetical protein